MSPEIERLLGGYATNTLTASERKLLYEAALEDQNLFNALEDEQALRELLADPESRQELVRALRPVPVGRRAPWVWGLAAAVAVLVVALLLNWPQPRPALVAVNSRAETVQAPAPAAPTAIAPAPLPKMRASPVSVPQRQFGPVSLSVGQLKTLVPFLLLRSHGDSHAVELPASEALKPGDLIEVRLRPGFTGTVTLSELLPGSAPKTLPPGAPIQVEVHKMIRIEWQNSSAILDLTPGQPLQLH